MYIYLLRINRTVLNVSLQFGLDSLKWCFWVALLLPNGNPVLRYDPILLADHSQDIEYGFTSAVMAIGQIIGHLQVDL